MWIEPNKNQQQKAAVPGEREVKGHAVLVRGPPPCTRSGRFPLLGHRETAWRVPSIKPLCSDGLLSLTPRPFLTNARTVSALLCGRVAPHAGEAQATGLRLWLDKEAAKSPSLQTQSGLVDMVQRPQERHDWVQRGVIKPSLKISSFQKTDAHLKAFSHLRGKIQIGATDSRSVLPWNPTSSVFGVGSNHESSRWTSVWFSAIQQDALEYEYVVLLHVTSSGRNHYLKTYRVTWDKAL